jgi:hypothetical protein
MKLLAALARRTADFGQLIELGGNDYPLAYVDSWPKLLPYLHYLQDTSLLIIHLESLGNDAAVSLTAAGLQASEGRSGAPGKIVFISSTCRDLMDCRDELARHLRDLGYVVRMSEQPSSFELPEDSGALASCLHNVKTSDVVVAILDSRYGSAIAIGDHAGKSVTHAEIDTALSCEINVLAFIRRPAFLDWELLRTDPAGKSTWVEPADESSRHGWMRLVSQLMHHTHDGLRSRWMDQFSTIVDLKSLVTQRLHSLNNR